MCSESGSVVARLVFRNVNLRLVVIQPKVVLQLGYCVYNHMYMYMYLHLLHVAIETKTSKPK